MVHVLPNPVLSPDSLLSGVCSRHHTGRSQRSVSSRTINNTKERVEHEAVEFKIRYLHSYKRIRSYE